MNKAINEAEKLYRSLVKELKIDQVMTDSGETVADQLTVDKWLPRLMLHTDEISVLLKEQRQWDALYVSSDENSIGLGTRPILSDDDKASTYSRYPLADDRQLRTLIVKNTLSEIIDITDDVASINPLNGYYDITAPLENNEVLPFQTKNRIAWTIFEDDFQQPFFERELQLKLQEQLANRND